MHEVNCHSDWEVEPHCWPGCTAVSLALPIICVVKIDLNAFACIQCGGSKPMSLPKEIRQAPSFLSSRGMATDVRHCKAGFGFTIILCCFIFLRGPAARSRLGFSVCKGNFICMQTTERGSGSWQIVR